MVGPNRCGNFSSVEYGCLPAAVGDDAKSPLVEVCGTCVAKDLYKVDGRDIAMQARVHIINKCAQTSVGVVYIIAQTGVVVGNGVANAGIERIEERPQSCVGSDERVQPGVEIADLRAQSGIRIGQDSGEAIVDTSIVKFADIGTLTPYLERSGPEPNRLAVNRYRIHGDLIPSSAPIVAGIVGCVEQLNRKPVQANPVAHLAGIGDQRIAAVGCARCGDAVFEPLDIGHGKAGHGLAVAGIVVRTEVKVDRIARRRRSQAARLALAIMRCAHAASLPSVSRPLTRRGRCSGPPPATTAPAAASLISTATAVRP